MDEILGHCRRMYYALLAISAALLILAFSPSRHVPYERAAAELTTLLSVKRSQIPILSCDSLAHARLARMADQLEARYGLAEVNLDSTRFLGPIAAPGAVTKWKNVGELLVDVERNPGGSCSKIVDVDSALRIAHHLAAGSGLPERICTGCRAFFTVDPTHASLDSDSALWTLRFVVASATGSGWSDWALPEIEVVDSSFGFLGLMKRDSALTKLYRPVGAYGEPEWLPALRDVEDEVHDLHPRSARTKLRRLGEEAKQTVSFFGMSVDEGRAVIVAPVVVLLMLLYVGGHLIHLRRNASAARQAVASYPWMPIFPGSSGRISSAIAFVLLPIGALILLFVHALAWVPLERLGLALAITAAAAYSGLRCVRLLRSIRNQVLGAARDQSGPAADAKPSVRGESPEAAHPADHDR